MDHEYFNKSLGNLEQYLMENYLTLIYPIKLY